MPSLRVRKSELQDIIDQNEKNTNPISEELVLARLKSAAALVDVDFVSCVRSFVTKVHAHADGSCTVNLGVVHKTYCGDRI